MCLSYLKFLQSNIRQSKIVISNSCFTDPSHVWRCPVCLSFFLSPPLFLVCIFPWGVLLHFYLIHHTTIISRMNHKRASLTEGVGKIFRCNPWTVGWAEQMPVRQTNKQQRNRQTNGQDLLSLLASVVFNFRCNNNWYQTLIDNSKVFCP